MRQRCQSSQNLANEVPAYLKTLDRITVINVLRQHDNELSLKLLWMPGHLHAGLQPLHPLTKLLLASMVVLQKDALHAVKPSHSSREHEVSVFISGVLLSIFRRRIICQHRSTIKIRTRATPRVHAISDTKTTQKAMTPHRSIDTLRKRDYVLPELSEPRRTHGHEINLHMLQRNKACLRHRRRREKLTQLLLRESITWIHTILPTAQWNNITLIRAIIPFLQPLKLHAKIAMTTKTPTCILSGHDEVLLRLLNLRHLVPGCHIYATRRQPSSTLVSARPPKQLQIQLVRWSISRMKRREALVTDRAVKHDHARQHHMHGQRSPERRLPQRHIVLHGA